MVILIYTVSPRLISELDNIVTDISRLKASEIDPAHSDAIRFLRGLNPGLAQVRGMIKRDSLAMAESLTHPTLKGLADSATSTQMTMAAYISGAQINWVP